MLEIPLYSGSAGCVWTVQSVNLFRIAERVLLFFRYAARVNDSGGW